MEELGLGGGVVSVGRVLYCLARHVLIEMLENSMLVLELRELSRILLHLVLLLHGLLLA